MTEPTFVKIDRADPTIRKIRRELRRTDEQMWRPLLCRLRLHRYRHVTLEMPPGSIPARDGIPSNSFSTERIIYVCVRCGRLHPRFNPNSVADDVAAEIDPG